MSMDKIREQIMSILPDEAKISKVEFLGPEIYIYSKNVKIFYETDKYVSELAFALKKRVNIRCDNSLLMEVGPAKDKILSIIPEGAKVSAVYFDNAFSEVVIEAFKPGLVIGKGGATTKEIILTTGWTPNIIRAPDQECKTIGSIRTTIYKNSKERKENLVDVAKQIYTPKSTSKEWIRVCPLGAFREIGRSAVLVQTQNSRIILDCGLNVASQDSAYPMLETLGFSLNDVTAVVISHAHTDHCGFLPYLYKVGYKGPVYCTPPTRDLMATMQNDVVNVAAREGKDAPYSESDIKEMLRHVIVRDYGEVTDISPDIRLTFHNASHILGSASVHLHIGDGSHNLMYSGDFKFGHTRLFDHMQTNYPRLETLIIEGTYCGPEDNHPQRGVAEERLISTINETIKNGGNVLIPVFAIGRSQEVMLVLEEYFRRNKLLAKKVYIDGLIKDICAIHTVYPEYLKESLEKRILQNNSPFNSPLFSQVQSKAERDEIVKQGGNVFIATSGMLTGGPSLEYFYKMASDEKNTIVFVGWQGDGSLGRKLLNGSTEIPIPDENGRLKTVPLRIKVENVEGFSGHSDRSQLVSYVASLSPMPKRILVGHCEREKGAAFARYLSSNFMVNSSAPSVLDCVRLK